jgi:hypothetical protein
MKLLTVSSLLFGVLIAAAPVSADEAWGEHGDKRPMYMKINEMKEQSYQRALEWRKKHVKQNWAQKLNGTYSTERIEDKPAQSYSNQSQFSAMRSQWKKSPNTAAPTLVSPRGGGEYKRLSHGFDTTGSGLKKESKLGLNLGATAGSSLYSNKLGPKKEGGNAATGIFGQKEREFDPLSQ